MKRLTIILFLLITIAGFAQTKGYYQQQSPNYGADYWYSSDNQYGGAPIYGKASFVWGITRSQYADNEGYYKYKVWFLSSSYIWDYYYNQPVWRFTYLWDVKIYLDGYLKKSCTSTSFRELMNEYSLTFYSKKINPRISLSANYKML